MRSLPPSPQQVTEHFADPALTVGIQPRDSAPAAGLAMAVVSRANRGVLLALLPADLKNCVTLSLPPVKINVQV